MAAKLALGKSIKREIQLRILPKPVVVELSCEGITVAAKRHKPVNITWGEIIERSCTPPNVPAKFYKQGLKYLESCMTG
jgi:hypothetical protein